MIKRHTTYTRRTLGVHRRSAAFVMAMVALGALAGCASEVIPRVEVGFLRNPTTPIGGASRFESARFAGEWQTVACIGTCVASERFIVATDGVYLREAEGQQTPYLISAPGVLRQMGGDATLVVMWVDEGFRTAAIGDAGGRWAAVIDRTGGGGADRLKAATEILDFNGWDTGKLRIVK